MGLLILGIVTIGFVIGFVTAFWLTCWVLRSRAKQHGMQAELKRLLSKPKSGICSHGIYRARCPQCFDKEVCFVPQHTTVRCEQCVNCRSAAKHMPCEIA